MGIYNFIRYCGMAAGPMVANYFVTDNHIINMSLFLCDLNKFGIVFCHQNATFLH